VGFILAPLRGLGRIPCSTFSRDIELWHRLLRTRVRFPFLPRHFRAGLSHAAAARPDLGRFSAPPLSPCSMFL